MKRLAIIWGLIGLLLLTACQDGNAPTTETTAVADNPTSTEPTISQPTHTAPPPTATPIPPTPTPSEPLAALVNGEPLFLSEYEKELSRYEQAQADLGVVLETADGTTADGTTADHRQMVLDALIERALILQAAEAAAISVPPETVEAKLSELRTAAGDPGNFDAWLQANQWTEDEFRQALWAEMMVGKMVAEVTAAVPYTAEQAHARYIQVDDLALAESLKQQLDGGADFAFLAQQNSLDRLTAPAGGDLGFFARGSLLVTAVEEAAFNLQPGDISEVITVAEGEGQPTYYLVQLIEIDPERPLTADLRYTLLQQTFQEWLDRQWQQAQIERFVIANGA